MGFSTNAGRSFPLGATVYPDGVNFSVFSKGATGVELLLFGEMDSPRPDRVRLHFDKASLETDLTLSQFLAQARYDWHAVKLISLDWSPDSHGLALAVVSLTGARVFHLMCDAYWEALSFQLPQLT